MARLGNTSASSLLKSAQAAYNRQAAYDDSIKSYEYDLSPKTEADYKAYESYLKDRAAKEQDPSKQLSLQKTITSAYRTYNSAEIFRQTEAVNYGDISNTDKYNRITGLYQQAISIGDYNLAQSLEGKLATLSITIQNERDAAASAASSRARSAGASATSAFKTQLQDLENKVDRAYQTGQPLAIDGQEQVLNASSYALYQASILKGKYDLLSAQAADDPKYADDLSSLQKSAEWRGLIDSGLVQFNDQGQPVATDGLKNLAVKFTKDKYGNTKRDFTGIPTDQNGNQQYGLIKDENGKSKNLYVADRQMSNTGSENGGRVAFDTNNFQQNGADVKGISSYNDLISGSQVLVDTANGLRATAYNGKKEQRTPDQALEDLKNLSNPQQFKETDGTKLLDAINGGSVGHALASANDFATKSGLIRNAIAGGLHGVPGFGGALSNIFRQADFGNEQKRLAEVKRKAQEAEAIRQQQAKDAALRAQDQLRQAQNAAHPSVLYSKPVYSPAQKFSLALPANPTPSQTSKAIGATIANVGGLSYNDILKKAGLGL